MMISGGKTTEKNSLQFLHFFSLSIVMEGIPLAKYPNEDLYPAVLIGLSPVFCGAGYGCSLPEAAQAAPFQHSPGR
jgi:hypothetical protein